MNKNPMQPLIIDENNIVRFKANEIVKYLLDNSRITLNALAAMPFSQEDREQFAQLIGYSMKGYFELSYVSDESCHKAVELMKELKY